MRKQYFWVIREIDVKWLTRFRSEADRRYWLEDFHLTARAIPGTHPEVRRIKRRLAAGEQITFPVEI